jgi:hypothetical protein
MIKSPTNQINYIDFLVNTTTRLNLENSELREKIINLAMIREKGG